MELFIILKAVLAMAAVKAASFDGNQLELSDYYHHQPDFSGGGDSQNGFVSGNADFEQNLLDYLLKKINL